jgi:hypothetical protein
MACRADATLQDLEGAALIVWPNGGGQRLCSAAWFSTEAATLGELLSPILGVAEATYSSRDE